MTRRANNALRKIVAARASARELREERRAQALHALASARAASQIIQRAVEANFRHELPVARRYVITAAQDASPVHQGFFKALQHYCAHRKAELVVIPLLYRALRSRAQKAAGREWAPALLPHLFAGRVHLGKHIAVVGDVKISPTKQSPLSGLDAKTLGASAVFGHPKLELRTVPTLDPVRPTILTTTGACTVSDYVDALSSKIAEFHHTIGACVVEIDGDDFHVRQINAATDTGEFIDLNKLYTEEGVFEAPHPLALVLGDTHVGSTDPKVHAATFGSRGIVDALKPKHVVYHDLLDGYTMNPHHADPFLAVEKQAAKRDDVEAEVQAAALYVEENTPENVIPVIVASNHNDFLPRWMRSTDWRELRHKKNALFYLETAWRMVEAGGMGEGGFEGVDPFAMHGRELARRAKFLGRRDSFVLGGVELSLHGDAGPNGARGSIRNLRRVGVKSIIGHSHSPGISEGAMQTGTASLLQLEYNRGPSSWAHAHALLYANGKRTLIFIAPNGRWRA